MITPSQMLQSGCLRSQNIQCWCVWWDVLVCRLHQIMPVCPLTENWCREEGEMPYRGLPVTASPLTEVSQHVCVETYRVVTLEVCVVSLPSGPAVLAVRQTEAHSDVILAVQFLIFWHAHDEVGEAELAHVCRVRDKSTSVWTGVSLSTGASVLPAPATATFHWRAGPTLECLLLRNKKLVLRSIIISCGASETNQELYFDAPSLPPSLPACHQMHFSDQTETVRVRPERRHILAPASGLSRYQICLIDVQEVNLTIQDSSNQCQSD